VHFQGNEKYFESKYHLVGGHGKYISECYVLKSKPITECKCGYKHKHTQYFFLSKEKHLYSDVRRGQDSSF